MAKSEPSIERKHFRTQNALSGELKEISTETIPVAVRSMPMNREQMLREWSIRLADTITASGVPMGDFNLSILEEELRAFLMANEPDWRNIARKHLRKLVWWIENKHGALPASALTTEEHMEVYNILLDIPQLQENICEQCLQVRQTPIRNDDMGGYVCLTCVAKELERLQAEGRRYDNGGGTA